MPRIGLISLYVSHAPVYNERATCVQQTQAFWTIHPVLGRRLTARRLHILAPNIAPNTDGFDPDSIQDVSFTDSYVSNGDDAIAIKAGWDCAGYASKEAAPCDNIYIRNITQNRGGGGLSLGTCVLFIRSVSCQLKDICGNMNHHRACVRSRLILY